jgi:hypothetical protein
LLSISCNRPYCCRAGEERQELAPFHSFPLHYRLISELSQKRRHVDSESRTALSLRTVIALDDKEIELGLAIP